MVKYILREQDKNKLKIRNSSLSSLKPQNAGKESQLTDQINVKIERDN